MSTPTPISQQALTALASRHGFAEDAILAMYQALQRGNGGMAQFDHPAFGGTGQWMRGGMTMVSDMFDHRMKARVDALCTELAELMSSPAATPATVHDAVADIQQAPTDITHAPNEIAWWGEELGVPDSTGSQNQARYAYFSQARRLAVEAHGRLVIYDTLDHRISGFSQQQAADGSMQCTSQHGVVSVASLPVVRTQQAANG